MHISDFVVALRSKIGHAPLPLNGVIAVVLDERDRVLLVRRSDKGEWALTTGCLEPGEPPNGDQVYWLAIGLLCRLIEGDARVNDDESVEVGWSEPDSVPPLPPHQARCLTLALAENADPWIADPISELGSTL